MDPELKELWKMAVPIKVKSIFKHMEKKNQAVLEEYGLSIIHVQYLMALSQKGYTLRGLSECLDLDKANTTRAISYLKETGFVYDDRKSESSRKYTIYLTEKGSNAVAKLNDSMGEMLDICFKDISDTDVRAYIRVIECVHANLESADARQED